MPQTSTIYTTFDSLSRRGDSAILVVKLMMAFNDLAVANEGLAIYKERYATKRTDKNRGAAMYFIRLQASHLYEAMTVVERVAASSVLSQLIQKCSEKARAAFARLVNLLNDANERRKFEQLVGRLRNNLTFHYEESGDLVRRAIEKRATNQVGNITSITRGDEPYSWRFAAADDVMDSIVCRQIWKIPETADLRAEADAAADYGHDIFVDFAAFSSEFIVRYVQDGA